MKHIFGKKSSQSGFSLVELMIVVGIIGVLSTLALPRFKQFQAKAKMAEAMNVLSHLYTLEQAYAIDNNQFLTMGAYGAALTTPSGSNTCTAAGSGTLGFVIEPCVAAAPTPRFSYRVDLNGSDRFWASATTGAAVNNRVCNGNGQFSITLSQSNAPTWALDANGRTNAGLAPIGSVCPN